MNHSRLWLLTFPTAECLLHILSAHRFIVTEQNTGHELRFSKPGLQGSQTAKDSLLF